MAEIINTGSKKNLHLKMRNKKSTRVDLTPMVDLGFLLITFFVFTTTMSQPKAMNLNIPNDKGQAFDPVCETSAFTVVLGQNNSLYYYEGLDENAQYKTTGYPALGIRNILVQKKKSVLSLRHKDDFILIIKPSAKATFKNLVDMVDEANICCIKRYYITELNEKDKEIIHRTENR
ncbi:MAG: biopolymer transporter ExbD [Ferruginibacter sp.]